MITFGTPKPFTLSDEFQGVDHLPSTKNTKVLCVKLVM